MSIQELREIFDRETEKFLAKKDETISDPVEVSRISARSAESALDRNAIDPNKVKEFNTLLSDMAESTLARLSDWAVSTNLAQACAEEEAAAVHEEAEARRLSDEKAVEARLHRQQQRQSLEEQLRQKEEEVRRLSTEAATELDQPLQGAPEPNQDVQQRWDGVQDKIRKTLELMSFLEKKRRDVEQVEALQRRIRPTVEMNLAKTDGFDDTNEDSDTEDSSLWDVLKRGPVEVERLRREAGA